MLSELRSEYLSSMLLGGVGAQTHLLSCVEARVLVDGLFGLIWVRCQYQKKPICKERIQLPAGVIDGGAPGEVE